MSESLNLNPVFLSDSEGAPAWAVLPMAQYRQLLELAGLSGSGVQSAPSAAEAQPAARARPAAASSAELIAKLACEPVAAGQFNPAKLAAARQKMSLSVADMARAVGVSGPYYEMFERGEREPSGPILASLARAANCSVEDLSGS